jgi:hypothetical protein
MTMKTVILLKVAFAGQKTVTILALMCILARQSNVMLLTTIVTATITTASLVSPEILRLLRVVAGMLM